MEVAGSVGARSSARSITAIAAIGSVALAAGLAAWGTFGESNASVWGYVLVLAIIGVAAVAVFGWVVPRGLRRESAGATAVALSVLGVLTIAVFWSGLPPVLAAGGIVLGLAGWSAHTGAALCRAAVVIGVFALVGDVAVYIQDMT
jgi:hypothetical protein